MISHRTADEGDAATAMVDTMFRSDY